MPSSHLILGCPLLLLPPTLPSIKVFPNESTLRMRWPKYWSFSFSIIPSKEIPGLISFRIKAMVFPVVMYGCESWTVKMAEGWRIDAFELWCWRGLLRVPWTARKSNQSILKEINPGISLEGMMLKLKLQYFGHLMWRKRFAGKDSDAGRDWGQEEKGTTEDEMAGCHHWLDGRESEWTLGVGDGQGGLACCDSWGRKESDMTEQLNWAMKERHRPPPEGDTDDCGWASRQSVKTLLRIWHWDLKTKREIHANALWRNGWHRPRKAHKDTSRTPPYSSYWVSAQGFDDSLLFTYGNLYWWIQKAGGLPEHLCMLLFNFSQVNGLP